MKNIGIMICNKYSYKCSGINCFKAFNNRTKAFERYRECNVNLMAFFHCNGCEKNFLEEQTHKFDQLKRCGVSTIHMSTCMVNKCHRYDVLKGDLINSGFDVVDGSH